LSCLAVAGEYLSVSFEGSDPRPLLAFFARARFAVAHFEAEAQRVVMLQVLALAANNQGRMT
jgi:hypothetical protein